MKPYEAKALVAILAAAYPRHPITDQTPTVYAMMLEDLDASAVTEAAKRHMAVNKWFPSISELRRGVSGSTVEGKTGELAWGEVRQAVGKFGVYQTPTFEDPITEIAVAQIGWRDICNSNTESLGYMRAAFVKSYNAACDRVKSGGTLKSLDDHQRKQLAGIHDHRIDESRGQLTSIKAAIAKVGK